MSDPLCDSHHHGTTLVLGATGKTGARVARQLAQRGLPVRTAARRHADVHFDWNDAATFAKALDGVRSVYLVSPVLRTDFAGAVSQFLDQAERAGVRHVTCLSAHGMEHAPREVALRAVELDLAVRTSLTHTILRPAWFMQNFSETFLQPVQDEIAVPCGAGAEAFVSADDIAAVAAETLAHPERHAGCAYAPTGPEALTFEDAARQLSKAAGRRITYHDIDREVWISTMVQAGVPEEYGEVLRALTETVAAGRGSRSNDDVQQVTGHPPTHFADFAIHTATAWR